MSAEVEVAAQVEEAVERSVPIPATLRENATAMEVWAFDLGQAYQIAVRLVTTSFVPRTYEGRPGEAAAAIMTGQEIGLSPLAALRSIDIIGGVPAMRAVAMRALVQSHGHEIWVEESTATQAVVAGRRRGSDKVERSVWTIERARGLSLLGKDNWKKQPIAMLLARATSELARLIAADVLLGIPYSVEEIEDLGVVAVAEKVAEAAPKVAPSRTVRRASKKAEPEVEPPVETPGEPDPEPEQEEPVEAEVVDESADGAEPFEGDPGQPTKEELQEWASLPGLEGEQ